MKLSICIVNYNSGRLLASCLDSLTRYSPSCLYEVIVVDNHSEDGSLGIVNVFPRTLLIQNQDNVGFAKANNQAFAISRGEYLLMLNADAELTRGALDQLLSCAAAHPQAGLVSAKLVNPDGSPQVGFNVRRLPNLTTAFAQLMLLDEIFPNNPLTRRYMGLDLDYNRLQRVEQPAASALLYRRTAWAQVGSFDERFSNWYNDVDLCKRVRDAGWELWFCPSAQVMHYGGIGAASRTAQSAIVEAYRSQRLYFYKHFGWLGYGLVSGFMIIGMILRLALLAILPTAKSRVNTRVKQDHPRAIRDAFKAVLIDVLKTWSTGPSRLSAVTTC
jgi:GT2 family glycosyltransferase